MNVYEKAEQRIADVAILLGDLPDPDAELGASEALKVRAMLKEVRDVCRIIEGAYTRHALIAADGDEVMVDGEPLVRTYSTTWTRWRNDDLRSDVLRHVRFDEDTGEERTLDDALRVLQTVWSLNGSGSKSGGLKKMGLAARDYADGDSKVDWKPPRPERNTTPPKEAL